MPVVRTWCSFKHGSDRDNDASTAVLAVGYQVISRDKLSLSLAGSCPAT